MHRFPKQRERGAVFVEAIIVISTMTLVLLSMVFFENMYLKKIRVARLARATAIAYSMRGCPDGQDAAQWASVDLDPKAGKNTPRPSGSPLPVPNSESNPDSRAGDLTKEMPGSGSNSAWVNPIADVGFSLRAGATTKTGLFGKRGGYGATMQSVSFVSCGEAVSPMDQNEFKSLVETIWDQFKDIVKKD